MKLIKITCYFILAGVLFNSCRKEYSLEGGGLKTPSGEWEFKDSLRQFQGDMDTAYIKSSAGIKELNLIGKSDDGSQNFRMRLYADTFKTGTYKASLFQSSFEYTVPAKTLYEADQLIGEFIVNITSFSDTYVSGTFSGDALDSAGTIKNLSQGKFTSTIGGSGSSVSSGVLGDSSGNCKPVTLAGVYAQGIALTSANTVQVQVTVAVAGTYSITSTTANGITFSKAGTFTSTGLQTVTLSGSGTPANAGNHDFVITYGNSVCGFKINFDAPATGILGGGGGNCTPFTIAGIFKQGTALNSSNTVEIQVDVSTPGSYNITTNTINGVKFFKSGTFTVPGLQTILLTGSGTPANSGSQTFAVNFGTSACNFSITFDPSSLGDYFPVTANSNWTYSLAGGTSSDSVHNAIIGYSPVFGANTYETIAAFDVPSPGTASDSFYYRKPGGDYYQYVVYSDIVAFDQEVSGEFIFLKDNVTQGTTWLSPTVNGNVGGVPVSAFIKMTLLEKAVPVVIGAFSFPDVIKVQYEYFIIGFPNALLMEERWFAKNVGEIHNSITDGTTTNTYDIGTYQIF